MPVCSHKARYSVKISGREAPIVCTRMYPLMPKVEGNIHEMTFQKDGTAEPGHEMPEMKSKGKEVNTNIIMQSSRRRIRHEHVIAKKMQASRNGIHRAINVPGCAS